MDEYPDCLLMGPDATFGQFGRQLAQRERTGSDALTEPLGMGPGQHALLVPIHLAWLPARPSRAEASSTSKRRTG